MPEWKSRKSQSAMSREKVLDGWQMNKATSEPGDLTSKVGTENMEDNYDAYGGYDRTSCDQEIENEQKENIKNMEYFQMHQPGMPEQYIRRKLPLSHTHNPLVKALVEMDKNQAQQQRGGEGGQVMVKDGLFKAFSESKPALLERWEQIKNQYSANQDSLGNLQYLGRNGTPGTVRYTAHDQGPAIERTTGQVLAHFARAMQQEGSTSTQSERPAFQTATLEEFYELNQAKLPHSPQEFSSDLSKLTRGASRDLHGRMTSFRAMTPSVTSQRPSSVASGGTQASRSAKFKRTMSSARGQSVTTEEEDDMSSVKVDDVLSAIDDVTSDMTSFKEKLVPDPKPGFRKPTVKIPQQYRQETAPAGCNSVVSDLSHDTGPSSAAPWPVEENAQWERGLSPTENRPLKELKFMPRSSYSRTPHARPTSVISQPKTETDIIFINHIEDDEPDHVTDSVPVEDAIQIFRLNSRRKKRRPPQYSESTDTAWLSGLDHFQFDDFFIREGAPQEYFTFCSSMSRKAAEPGKGRMNGPKILESKSSSRSTAESDGVHSSALQKLGTASSKILVGSEDLPQGLSQHRELIDEINRLLGHTENSKPQIMTSESQISPKETTQLDLSKRNIKNAGELVFSADKSACYGDNLLLKENDYNRQIADDNFQLAEIKFTGNSKPHNSGDQTEIKLTSGFKHRLYQRVLPSATLKPSADSDSLRLTIMGGPRMSTRNAGRVPEKARASSPLEGKRKEKETLRRAREGARTPRTAPSIPIQGQGHSIPVHGHGPSMPFQGQGQITRLRGPHLKELEDHARLHPKSLAYLGKIEALRQPDKENVDFPNDDFASRDFTTSSIKVHSLRGQASRKVADAGPKNASQTIPSATE